MVMTAKSATWPTELSEGVENTSKLKTAFKKYQKDQQLTKKSLQTLLKEIQTADTESGTKPTLIRKHDIVQKFNNLKQAPLQFSDAVQQLIENLDRI